MFCKNCGNEIDENSLKCSKCGAVAEKNTSELSILSSQIIDLVNTVCTGVISRKSYWYQNVAILISWIVCAILWVLIEVCAPYDQLDAWLTIYGYSVIYYLAISCSYSWILVVKRLHDFNATGWLSLFMVVPLLGIIAFIVIGCVPSKKFNNPYLADVKSDNLVIE